ncbi:MAG: hypothetical protein AAB655_01720, partial [Patescibacteria group bacterium]
DYDNGGGKIGVWTGNNICGGSPTVSFPSSGLKTDIVGGDIYTYYPKSQSGFGKVVATSSVIISSTGLINL